VHTKIALPSFSDLYIVYSELSGGVFNNQGLSLLPISKDIKVEFTVEVKIQIQLNI
jgi:hypothetical protein